ncbi:hypothetical protein FGO68_gene10536 [Halteria grandinella]|uniref:Uncharacterized protein n=1 Tax=Halteria grandinella TaxID=5974 RepID=A0A8J8T7T6_HALGN|nr:hypothetical protein FGO68_gene10536 [Halteria grandinella]
MMSLLYNLMSTTCCFCFPSTSASVHHPHRKDRKSSAVPNDLSALKMRDGHLPCYFRHARSQRKAYLPASSDGYIPL